VFSLSLRDVELLLVERGIAVSYETIRRWCRKFGESFANSLRRRRPRPGDKWHLDEVFIRIQGVQHYLWRAVDQNGVVLDILVQDRRDGNAAKRFFKRLLKGLRNDLDQSAGRDVVGDDGCATGVALMLTRRIADEACSIRDGRRREHWLLRCKTCQGHPSFQYSGE
jgi:transposase-like protein